MSIMFICGSAGCYAVDIDDEVREEVGRQRRIYCEKYKLHTGRFPDMGEQEDFVAACYQRLTRLKLKEKKGRQ